MYHLAQIKSAADLVHSAVMAASHLLGLAKYLGSRLLVAPQGRLIVSVIGISYLLTIYLVL